MSLSLSGSSFAQLSLTPLGSYATGVFDESAAEIPTYDPATQRLFVVNANNATVDILDISDPENPVLVMPFDASAYGDVANSVAISNGLVAVAIEAETSQDPGSVVFIDADGNLLGQVEVGALPDMLTLNGDGTLLLVANEGEPDDDYTVDPEGSISIVDVTDGVEAATVMTASFEAFNNRAEHLRSNGVRIFGPGASVAQDLEPEYIAVAPDDTLAYAIMQEANALAVVDIDRESETFGMVLDILPLGYKDFSRGLPVMDIYPFPAERPELGTSVDGQTVLLGGLSGLFFEGTDDAGNLIFISHPDRGPDAGSADRDGSGENDARVFLLPELQAQLVRFSLNPENGEISIVEQIPLTDADGNPISGRPNLEGDDGGLIAIDAEDNVYEFDPLGADLEGIAQAPDGTYWLVDEYRPAIYHVLPDGVLNARYVPEGTDPEGASIYGQETLPADYALRRANRGFEAVAYDTDEDVVYAFIQTPLMNPDRDASDGSSIIRMLGVNPADGTPVSEYVIVLEKPSFAGGNVDKIGDAVYAGGGTFYIIERDSGTDARSVKTIFELDLLGATNLLDAEITPVDSKTLEQHSADELVQAGITPVFKRKLLNLPSYGYLPSDKPEGLALLPDGSLAVLNDNDFVTETPIELGHIRFAQSNMLDASNEDGVINMQHWPVLGTYQPDAIAAYEVDGATYIVTANEGDSRDYDGFSEEERIADVILDETRFPDAEMLQEDANLGRLLITTTQGDLDGDGDFDKLFAYGARSFSIFDAGGNLVFDSGDMLESTFASIVPAIFNSQGDSDSFDNRSDDKGPEPEGIALGEIDGRTYAFIGLERIGGIIVYDITEPTAPSYVTYVNTRNFGIPATTDEDESISNPEAGDISPEGLVFISAEDSPTGEPILAVSFEVSGSTTLFSISAE
ncbi:MAG: choice-of-anchor I family protein [Deinococcota bacterium]